MSRRSSLAVEVALSAVCAVLYAMGSLLTTYIHSPWGAGQFRPAVVIPAVLSTLFGPMVGGLGAAIGTLLADSISHGQFYIRSLVSSVPGNFVGFYLFGWLMKRKFNWGNYIRASQITLLLANGIVAFLYVYFRVFVEGSYPIAFRETWIYISLGLVAWWYVTMLPFVLLIGPPLIRALVSAFPGMVPEQANLLSKTETSKRTFSLAMIVPGVLMLLIGAAITFTDSKQIIALGIATNTLILAGMQIMFMGSGVILIALGLLLMTTGRWHTKT